MRISIIGPSEVEGNLSTYVSMYDTCIDIISNVVNPNEELIIVSGGSSWSDHIAITVYASLKSAYTKISITLYIPCEWSEDRYIDTGSTDWRVNPGWLLNKRHRVFSSQTGIESLREISYLMLDKNVQISKLNGFHSRNDEVAKCDALICFSHNNNVSGGSKYTYDRCLSTKKVILIIGDKPETGLYKTSNVHQR